MADKAQLLEKIKSENLCPCGTPTARTAMQAVRDLQVLAQMTDLDKKVAHRAHEELVKYVAEYRRALRVKRGKRKKHTRG